MILSSFNKFRDLGLLLLRLSIGVLLIWTGWPLLAGGTHKWLALGAEIRHLVTAFPPIAWGFLIAFSYVIGGTSFALGFLLRPAALLLTIIMGTTTFIHFYAGEPFVKWTHVAEFTIVFLSFLFIGAGRYSFDGD